MAFLVTPSCLVYEDDHLLVANKPPNLNTHAASPWSNEGLYDWLRNRDPRWRSLAIIHRLDKATSGVLVFAKSDLARRSLTHQFAVRQVAKKYLLLTDRPAPKSRYTLRSVLVRSGSKYLSRPESAQGELAVTHFQRLPTAVAGPGHLPAPTPSLTLWEAIPVTGRTHQVRVQAAALGLTVLGDVLYGGTPAPRVFLHAWSLTIRHPETGALVTFSAPLDFSRPPWLVLREALLEGTGTDACRWIHGEADGWPGFYLDRLGPYLLAQSDGPLNAQQTALLNDALARARAPAGSGPTAPEISQGRAGCPQPAGPFVSQPPSAQRAGDSPPYLKTAAPWPDPAPVAVYHRLLTRQIRGTTPADVCPRHLAGPPAGTTFLVRENDLFFELSLGEGYSVGLFLDQRDNRRRFLVNQVAVDFPLVPEGLAEGSVLNTFAYTCGFSVCAARAGACTTNLDLSRKYLEWGKRNFLHNRLEPGRHDFICGDVWDWLRRWARKERRFDVVILDPPTFSQSKKSGLFRADRDYAALVRAALPVLKSGGVLFASTNAHKIAPEQFLNILLGAVGQSGRRVRQRHYAAQPPDFPVHAGEPAHLKTVWLRVD